MIDGSKDWSLYLRECGFMALFWLCRCVCHGITANVDPENEADLVRAIDELTRSKTILMIAHRLKTVRKADNIVVIENGKIAEQGKHEELIDKGGIYSRFVDSRNQAVGWKI